LTLGPCWYASIRGHFIPQQQPGAFGSLAVRQGGGPVNGCLPLVLALVTGPGRGRALMVCGKAIVGLAGAVIGSDGGGKPPLRGSLRGGHLALCLRKPLGEGGWGPIVVAAGSQLVNPRADSVKALPDLLPAGLSRVIHASTIPGLGRLSHAWIAARRSGLGCGLASPSPFCRKIAGVGLPRHA
jgi:hypothetical protein